MEDETFVRLVDAYYAPLFRFALSLARDEADASDLTQQTFYVWATKGDTIRDVSKAKTWLFTTLYREFIRGRRKHSRVSSIEELPPAEREQTDLSNDDVAKLDNKVVLDALGDIQEIFRVPLTLFYLKDMTYQEIASILEVPIGTVMSRLSRGKAHLKSALAARLDGGKVIEFPKAQLQ